MLICKGFLSEDCIWICTIPNKHQPEITKLGKKTRRKKERKVHWISCNSCRNWVHPICTGLTKKENKKINKIIKEKRVDFFFKFLKCSLKSIASNGSLTEIVQNQLHTKRPITKINFLRKTSPAKKQN